MIKVAFIVSVISVSSLAMADGGDRAYGRIIQENEQKMQEYTAAGGKTLPEVTRYQYGMKLDIAKFVNLNSTHKCNAYSCIYFVRRLPAQAFA